MRRFILLSFLVAASARVAVAQGVPARDSLARRQPAYFEFQVERPATMTAQSARPVYPPALEKAGVEGQVLAQFVVDEEGVPDPATFKVLRSSHELFSQAVREALPRMRFTPASVDGHAVKQVIQMPFVFDGRTGS